jgi:hypothetical protein
MANPLYVYQVARKAMKVTTVRFSEDLWNAVLLEAERAGVSASQYIREAALSRAAAAAGARGEILFDTLPEAIRELPATSAGDEQRQREIQRALAMLNRAMAGAARSDSEALKAQSQQAMRTARRVRGLPLSLDLSNQADPEELADDGAGTAH